MGLGDWWKGVSGTVVDFVRDDSIERDKNGVPITGGDEFSQAGAGIASETPLTNEPDPNITVDPDVFGPTNFQFTAPEDKDTPTVDTSETEERSSIVNNPSVPTENLGKRFKNALEPYASYSCVTTLAVLSKEELADPDNTYRKNGPQHVILKSGGTPREDKALTIYEEDLGITTEYFIDNIEIDSILTPQPLTKQSNATVFRFQIIEPYSMGMLFESIAASVVQTGDERTSYIEAPFLLKIDFVGYNDAGEAIDIPNTTRYFTLKLDTIEFNVNAGGSIYDVAGYAWNEQAFADEVQTIDVDLDIRGSTVAELLQFGGENQESATFVMNKRQLELKNAKDKSAADAFIVMFPVTTDSESDPYRSEIEDPQGATSVPPQIGASIKAVQEDGVTLSDIENWARNDSNINKIGNSIVDPETFKSGNSLFGIPETDINEDGLATQTDKTYNTKDNYISIRKGKRLQDIIEELIILSEYGQNLVDAEPDKQGKVPWFRIETEVYEVSDKETQKKRGKTAKIYVFRVVPYMMHQSLFIPPSKKSPGIPVLTQNIPKEYNYLYSGQNDDIIDFELKFNNAFFQAIQIDLYQAGQNRRLNGQTGQSFEDAEGAIGTSDADERGNTSNELEGSVSEQSIVSDTQAGIITGASGGNQKTQIARQLNQAIVNGVDLIQAEMEIWGDPYYITDTGIGNYRASSIGQQTTSNGTMEYQYSEPYLLLNFRTPIDINAQTGKMDFPAAAGEPVRKFSGIYRITE